MVGEGLKPAFHQLDINDLSSITAAAAYFKDKYGGVDILVNNAGIAFKGTAVCFLCNIALLFFCLINKVLCIQLKSDSVYYGEY